MRIIAPDDFVTMPWKNGGGITHEIAKREDGGRLLWRLSIAEVRSDGPFSIFPGLSRILTVIEGSGLALKAPDRILKALPFAPLTFSGDLPIESRRMGDDVRDFNVIFDATALEARVDVLAGEETADVPAGGGVLALGGGRADGAAIAPGRFVLADTGFCFASAGAALRVTLTGR